MTVNAYCPDILFNTAAFAAASVAAIAAPSGFGAAATPAVTAATGTPAAATLAAAAGSSADAWLALLRYVKFTWGAGFFVAAFACNCLKTAADREHLWKPANRQASKLWRLEVVAQACVG